jgi:hypothetical protein
MPFNNHTKVLSLSWFRGFVVSCPFEAATLLAMTMVALSGCGSSPITPVRIEDAIEPTFANLAQLQISRLGHPSMSPTEFEVTASCRKLTGGRTGSGDWVCNLAWRSPDGQLLRDTYDLFVGTDGCYAATVEGGKLGGPSITLPDGRDTRNLLFAFDGCFDTT